MNIAMLLYVMVGLLWSSSRWAASVFAFAGIGAEEDEKARGAVVRPTAMRARSKGAADTNQQRRKNVQTMLKELEKQHAQQKKRPSLRRRIEQAGLTITPQTYWIMSGIAGVIAAVIALFVGEPVISWRRWPALPSAFGLPRWALGFLKARREKAFTAEFANAIDVIVRSVKSGLPVNEALKVVASEIAEPVGGRIPPAQRRPEGRRHHG